MEHLEAKPIFVEYCSSKLSSDDAVVVISPDAGGLKRAGYFREALSDALERDVAIAFIKKTRALGRLAAGERYGPVEGATAIIIDDMISTGGTLSLAAERAKRLGAQRVYAAARHGVFVGDAANVLDSDALDQILVTDTIPPFRLPLDVIERKLAMLTCAPLFATAIHRLHHSGPLSNLRRLDPGLEAGPSRN